MSFEKLSFLLSHFFVCDISNLVKNLIKFHFELWTSFMELKITIAQLHINPNCLSTGDNSGIWLYIYCKSPNGVRYFRPNATNLLEDRLARLTLMLCCDPNLKSVELRLIKWQKEVRNMDKTLPRVWSRRQCSQKKCLRVWYQMIFYHF